jgi:hypothetical protein
MDSIDQLFDFIKRGEHALVNLNPHFVLVPKYAGIVSLFVHTVYRSHDFHTHAFLPNKFRPLQTRRAKICCATQTEDFGQLVASPTTAARPPARKSSPATGTIAVATGFLRTRFVHHERATFDIQAVELSDGLRRVIFRPEFNKSETFRPARVPIHDYSRRDRLIALPRK